MIKVLAIISEIEKVKEFKHAFEGIYQDKIVTLSNNTIAEIDNFIPECIVIYISGATRQRLYSITDLREDSKFGSVPLILISDDEDKKVFNDNVIPGANVMLPEFTDMETVRQSIDRAAAASHIKKHILVVDDDLVALKVTKGYLEKYYKVTCVKSGAQAIKFIERQLPDAILLDCYMPEMDGPTTLKRIRILDKENNIPVVFLTGNSERNMVMRSISMKPSGFLLKPINQNELLEKMADVVR